MESGIRVLLQEWNLEEFIDKFEEESITIDLLDNLIKDNNLLQIVIPKIGKRLLFIKKVKEYFDEQQNLRTENLRDFQSSKNPSTTQRDESQCSIFGDALLEPSEDVNYSVLFNGTLNSNIDEKSVVIFSPSTSTVSSICDPCDEEPPPKKVKTLNTFLNNFDLRKTLESSAIGKALLNWYSVKGNFDSSRQGYLVDIVVSEFLNRGFTHINNNDYALLSRKIIDLFPNEISEAYFLPPIKKRDSLVNKPGLARGKLVDKFRNKLTFLREAGILPSRGQVESVGASKEEDSPLDSSYENHVLWLKHNREPKTDVYDHWDRSFTKRRQKLLKEGGDLKDIFSEYPILVDPVCLPLVEREFEKIFPGKSSCISNWETIIKNLISFRRQYVTSDTDKLLLDLLRSDALQDDYKIFLMFSLLPSLLPNRSRHTYGKNRKQWKPTISDTRNALILRVDLAGDIENEIRYRADKLYSLEIPFHPFIVVEANGTTVQHIYLYINGHLHKVGTMLKAIDLCFKTYHCFHIKYQLECEHIWFYIQHAIYQIKTKWDLPIPNILDIANKTKNTNL